MRIANAFHLKLYSIQLAYERVKVPFYYSSVNFLSFFCNLFRFHHSNLGMILLSDNDSEFNDVVYDSERVTRAENELKMEKNRERKNRISDEYFRFCLNFTDRCPMQRKKCRRDNMQNKKKNSFVFVEYFQLLAHSKNLKSSIFRTIHIFICVIFRCVNTHCQPNITNVQNCTVFFRSLFFFATHCSGKNCKQTLQNRQPDSNIETRRKEAKYAQFNTFSDNN